MLQRPRHWLALLSVLAAPAAATADIVTLGDANIRLIEPGETVAVSRIPDGIYLRTVNDPDDTVWERLPEYRVLLADAPAVHESVALRQSDEIGEQFVYVTLARTSDRFYVRLRWFDSSADTETAHDRFRDGAAVQFALGDENTSYIMGTGPEEPVNIWYWLADANRVESLAAGGAGSTTRLDEQPASGDGQYIAAEDESQWVVVMSRPIAVDGEYQVALDRDSVPMAFALWQGSDAHRDGFKRVSEDWILADLSAE